MKRPVPVRLVITAVLALAVAAVPGLLSPPQPASAYDFPTWKSIAAGDEHSCVLRTDGYVECWGSNWAGQLGDGTNTPTTMPSKMVKTSTAAFLKDATSITANTAHTCARKSDGTVWCWGWNYWGQLGNGTFANSNTAVPVFGLSGAVAVDAGDIHTCAIVAGGAVKCWGDNKWGELGAASTETCTLYGDEYPCSSTPVTVPKFGGAVEVESGAYHTCARKSNGTVWCWGYNSDGQLGNGTTTDSLVPVKVTGIGDAIDISTGADHTCAVLSGGAVKCWGDNSFGDLGNGTTTDSTTPVFVTDLGGAVSVGAGAGHTCARLSNNTVKCWGWNWFGMLGNGSNTDSTTPVTVLKQEGGTLQGVLDLAVGWGHSCALVTALQAYCWGYNSGGSGQLGDGTTIDRNRAVQVLNLQYAQLATITTGGYTSCALLGGAKCWGYNAFGQVGDGTLEDRLSPVPVLNLSGASAISGGEVHTCAIADAGSVRCWGNNGNGQLGDGTTTDRSTPVTAIAEGATEVAAGGFHTCAVHDGYVDCWGENQYGQLGDGSWAESHVPVPVVLEPGGEPVLLSDVVTVAAGDSHTCALLAGGTVMCWGNNNSGQLGDGTYADRNLPVFVVVGPSPGSPPLTGVIAITAGAGHTCALLDDAGVMCWGSNQYGQLGDGKACGLVTCNVPTPVAGGADVGWSTSLALDAGGNPVVSYFDGYPNNNLKLLHCDDPDCAGGGDSITSPDTEGFVGLDTALALDGDGNPVISYTGNDAVKLVHCNDPNCAGGDESITSPEPGPGNFGAGTLVLDAGGNPVVGYVDATAWDLKLLHCNDPDCAGGGDSINSPDTVGDVGGYISLALDGGGNPVLSYADFTTGNLKVLHCDDPYCAGNESANMSSPDTNAGSYTSLALDALGNPVISYWGGDADLKVLHCNDPKCMEGGESITSPDTEGDVGRFTSLALDAGGNPVVSYGDWTKEDLKVLHCGDPNCTSGNSITSADAAGRVGDYNSLVLDCADFDVNVGRCLSLPGNPVVSYYDSYPNRNLKLLHCNDANCAGGGESITSPDTGANLYTAIEAGREHTCAIRADGKADCWGHNDHGQLVNGATTDRTTPVAMSLGAGDYVVRLAAGGPSHTCVVLGSGVIKCAGQNDSGQLGNGTDAQSTSLTGTTMDTDEDGCADGEEREGAPAPKPGATGDYSQVAWYDFYDVPLPAIPDPDANGPKDRAVAMDDVLAVLFYVGTYEGDGGVKNPNGVAYDIDKEGDTVKDGRGYDRTPGAEPNPPWDVGPPDGAVSMDDVLAVLAQVGLSCVEPP